MTLTLAMADGTVRRGKALVAAGMVGVAALFVMAWGYSPIDQIQGPAFRIIYLHVPAASVMELAFGLVGVAGIIYLWLKDSRLDLFAAASAEAGMIFGAMVLLTGPLWARGVWGKWWVWEPRLTLTLLLWMLFAGYFALRSVIQDPVERARFAAVLGIMALVLLPFIHLATDLWPSQHPPHVVFRPPTNDPNVPRLAWPVARTLIVGSLMFLVCYLGAVTMRYGAGLRDVVKESGHA